MNNIINNWSYDKPTEPGDYLCCKGDVETFQNVNFQRFSLFNGRLSDDNLVDICRYHESIKFARLVYSPTEIKEIEDGQ